MIGRIAVEGFESVSIHISGTHIRARVRRPHLHTMETDAKIVLVRVGTQTAVQTHVLQAYYNNKVYQIILRTKL